MSRDTVLFRLSAEGAFSLSYTLSVGMNGKLVVYDQEKKKNRAIRYCRNEPSLYLDEQSSHAVVESITFEDTLLEVSAKDTNKLEFLRMHPGNVANGGTIFQEVDFQKEAADELRIEDMILDVKEAIRVKAKNTETGVAALRTVLASLQGSMSGISAMSPNELRAELFAYVDSDPTRFVNSKGEPNLFDDPKRVRMYVTLSALESGVIVKSLDGRKFTWKTGEELISIPLGRRPEDYFADFLETPEGILVFEEIMKQLK